MNQSPARHAEASMDAEELAAHLETCEPCAARIRLARRHEVPAWAREWEARRAGRLPFWKTTVARFLAVALLAVVASLAVMAPAFLPALARGRLWSPDGIARARGAPHVELWRVRDGGEEPWRAELPCAPGDRLRLKVQPSAFHHVGVALRESESTWRLSFTQPVEPGRKATLRETVALAPGKSRELALLYDDRPLTAATLEVLNGKDSAVFRQRFLLCPP